MLLKFPLFHRTLLSLLPPAHPPLSTRHQAHILESEFTKCSEQNGNRSTNQLAVGRQLIDVYREGGREWDVERGRVMVAMATADRYMHVHIHMYICMHNLVTMVTISCAALY